MSRGRKVSLLFRIPGVSAAGFAETNPGWAIAGALGYDFEKFRFEGEVSYRRNNLDSLTVKPITLVGVGILTNLDTFDLGGTYSSPRFLVNGYYEISVYSPINPFIGMGGGVSRSIVDVESIGGLAPVYDRSDTVFSYQVIAGLAYEIAPTWPAQLTYRFFGTTD